MSKERPDSKAKHIAKGDPAKLPSRLFYIQGIIRNRLTEAGYYYPARGALPLLAVKWPPKTGPGVKLHFPEKTKEGLSMVVRKSRKRHSASFRAQVALASLRGDRTIGQLTSQFGIHATLIYKWKKELQAGADRIFAEPGKGSIPGNGTQAEKEKSQLFEQIGRLKMELEWVKKNSKSTINELRQIIEPDHQELSIRRQCSLLGLARSTYYLEAKPEPDFNLQLMEKLDRIFMDFPFLGARRLVRHLKSAGLKVNRKRIVRLMRIMGLEPIYPKPKTTRKCDKNKVYPYLLKGLKVTVPNQVWCTDITYIPMPTGHMYLAAIMDWYSRYVIGWNLSNTLDGAFCVEMLEQALTKAKPRIFNTDQGAQFTSEIWIRTLVDNGIQVSMDGRGCFYDNIFIERLWRTVKYEEIYLKGHRDVAGLRKGLTIFFKYYNERRYHQSLDYKFPSEVYYGKPIKLKVA